MTIIKSVEKINENNDICQDDVPKPLTVIEENIPDELKGYDQWVVWKLIRKPNQKKPSKVPKNPKTGYNAKSNDPSTWSKYDTTLKAYKSGKYDGIGFMTTKNDPYLFWDLDEAYDSQYNIIESGFDSIVIDLSSYTEISPSGSGLRIIVKGQKPIPKSKKGWIEIYDSGRFLTITGHSIIPGIRKKQPEINELFDIIFETTQQNLPPQISQTSHNSLPDKKIIEKALKSANGEKFHQLYIGDTSGYGGDHSSADQAFCCYLAFWCDKDIVQIDRIFRTSALMRPKWDEIHSADGRTYGAMTIGKAVQLPMTTYNPDYYLPVAAGQAITDNYHLTDTGNGERFAEQHKKNVRYCHHWKKWLTWDGKRWRTDNCGKIKLLAKDSVRKMYADASNLADNSRRQSLAGWAISSEAEYRKMAMIASAQSEPGIPVHPDDLDQNPDLLNLENGTIDLHSNDFRSHRRCDLISKICPVEYDPSAKAPTWDRFINEIFCHNQNQINFVQQAVGYSLNGDTSEQCIFFCYGTGANGKSTFLETIATLMGEYSMHADFVTFLSHSNMTIRNDLARLKGSRFVCAIEAEEDTKFSEVILKQVTGGEPITARFLHQEFFEYKPEFKIWLAANHMPLIRGTNDAIWRRIHLIPFEEFIPNKKRDKTLLKKLKKELPGILNWALEGCKAWRKNGLVVPNEIKTATDAYRKEMDVIAQYFDDRIIVNSQACVPKKLLYADYVGSCIKNNISHLGKIEFNKAVSARGFSCKEKRVARTKDRFWVGIALKDSIDNPDMDTEHE